MISKFRLLALPFVGVAMVGIVIIGGPAKFIGMILMAIGLVPSAILLLKAKAEEA